MTTNEIESQIQEGQIYRLRCLLLEHAIWLLIKKYKINDVEVFEQAVTEIIKDWKNPPNDECAALVQDALSEFRSECKEMISDFRKAS